MAQQTDPVTPGTPAAEKLLRIVRALALEMHPKREGRLQARLDSRLDRDLGIDSLGRTELLLRLERGFGIRLAEELLGEAETPADLLTAVEEAIRRGGEGGAFVSRAEVPMADELPVVIDTPENASTLVAVLDWHVQQHPDRLHVTVLKNDAEIEATLTYGELLTHARQVAKGLQNLGVKHGDRVALMMTTGIDFFAAYFGCLYAGAVAVTIYPPVRMSQLEEHMRRQARSLGNAGCEVLIVSGETAQAARLLTMQLEALRQVETVASLSRHGEARSPERLQGSDLAFIQYTSGSTGDPKGVMMSHENLLENIRSMREALQAESKDVFVSWLPLYHDMGLIGAWLGSLYCAFPLYIMSPLTFLMRPQNWLWAIHRYRATMTAGPNFAFELCLARIEDRDLEGLDLGSLRMLANGAEPVSPLTLRRFIQRFEPYGLKPESIFPVYGLAENAVGLAFPPLGRGPVIDRIDRDAFMREGEARPVTDADANVIEIVNCGRPIPRHSLRIVDSTGREVADRHEGRIQFKGPSATSGYFNNPTKTRSLFDGDWLDTGDLGYMAGGELYISGRVKDIIIRSGRNVYPHELESAVGEIDGVRKGCVAVFGSTDAASGTEQIVILAETREKDDEKHHALQQQIAEVANEILGTPPEEIVLAPPGSVPKTSSGKLRRAAAREMYEKGQVGRPARAVWLQLLRLGLSGLGLRLRHFRRLLLEMAYALRWWLVAVPAAILAWLVIVLWPGNPWRVAHGGMRGILRLAGIRVRSEGLRNLPVRGAVLVCNHASYLDGLILAAVLPDAPIFIAKQELKSSGYAGPLLRRLGAQFVERWDPSRGVKDLQPILNAARSRRLVVFFPEGTFRREPGLLPFRLGGFVTAAESGLPVVPAVLRGTRSMLRANQWFPRRGTAQLVIGPPIESSQSGFDDALRLSQAARRWMLEHCEEPDAADEYVEPG